MLLRKGYEVYLLTWDVPGALHQNFEKMGARPFSASVKGRHVFFYINQARFLVQFCRTHKIDLVLSHQQNNAVVAGMAKYFMKAKCYYFRHNSDYVQLSNSRMNVILNKLANRLSRNIVAISNRVKEQLIKEGVDKKKILRINYCYNFSQYRLGSTHSADVIKEKYNADLLLLMVARLDPLKRHVMAFEVVKQLAEKGINCKLVSIGDGPMREELQQWIDKNGMGERIVLENFVTNTVDYFDACDLLIHLSYSEASSHVVKEAAMCNKAVIACRDVGDFNDYLEHNVNALLADKENPVPGTVDMLAAVYQQKEHLQRMGKNLCETVINTFSIEAVEKDYEQILNP